MPPSPASSTSDQAALLALLHSKLINRILTRTLYASIVSKNIANPSPALALSMVTILSSPDFYEDRRATLFTVLGGSESCPRSIIDPPDIFAFYTDRQFYRTFQTLPRFRPATPCTTPAPTILSAGRSPERPWQSCWSTLRLLSLGQAGSASPVECAMRLSCLIDIFAGMASALLFVVSTAALMSFERGSFFGWLGCKSDVITRGRP